MLTGVIDPAIVCAHTFSDYESCQRCGMPTCTECLPRGVILSSLRVDLPFSLCSDCRVGFAAANALASWEGDDVGAAGPARLGAAAAVLLVLERAPWHGRGERVTIRGRAVAAAIVTAPALVLGGLFGALKGCAVGALGGLVSGGMYGGVVGFDAGARVGVTGGGGPNMSVKDVTGSSSGAVKAAAVKDANANANASPNVVNSAVANDSNSPSPITVAPADTPAPRPSDDVMARARAILKKSPEEQIADASAELVRVTAKGVTAYDVLRITKDAAPEVVAKAHKAAAMAYHPDRNAAPDATGISQAVNAAYAILNDPARRAAYDAGGAGDVAGADDGLAAAAAGPQIKIKGSRVATAAATAGGFFGGVMGLGIGAVGGALVGTIGEAALTARKVWSHAGRDVSPADVAGGRSRLARAALATRTAAIAWSLPGVDVGIDTTTGDVRVRCLGLRSALISVKRAIQAPSPARMTDLPPLDDMTFAPSPKFIDRLALCAGPAPASRVFTAKLARALAASAKAARKELNVPEPTTLDDGDGVAAASGDATGLVSEDTYDAALERRAAEHAAKGPITSGRGLVGHAMTEVMEMGRSAAAKDDARMGLLLAAAWEAASRGRDPSADVSWISRRFAGLAGVAPESTNPPGLPLDDPDKGWEKSAAPPRSFDAVRPAAFLEVAVLAAEGAVIAKPGLGRASFNAGGKSVPSGLPQWLRVGELSFGANGDGDSATVRLPIEILVTMRDGSGGVGTAQSRLGVRVVVDAAASGVADATGVTVATTIVASVNWEAIGGVAK